jgi:phage shock protein E
MRRIWIVLALALAACGTPKAGAQQHAANVQASATQTEAQKAPVTRADSLAQVVFVDVRTPQEFEADHVKGAINIPYDQMQTRWKELAQYRDKPMVVYCRTGHRAGIALSVLEQHDFPNAINGGGLAGLEQHGIPTTAASH